MAEVKAIPTDRTVDEVWTADEHRYHIWADDYGGVTVQVGCHRSHLTTTEARVIAGFLEAASTNQESHVHHH